MKKVFIFSSVLMLILITHISTCNAQLTKIWDRGNENFIFERVCVPGKLAIVSLNGVDQFLIDLNNGETIYSASYPIVINYNYWGDRFYTFNLDEKIFREYDIKTKEFLKIVPNYPANGDSSNIGFDYTTHSIRIRNGNTGEIIDIYKIPNTPDQPTYSTPNGFKISCDGRYVAFYLQRTFDPERNNFLIYDRVTREIIMQKELPVNGELTFKFFNKSNLMAISEQVKLPNDDKKYSYICIYSPDERKIVKNIRIGDEANYAFHLTIRNDDKYILYETWPSNETRFYDYVNDKKLDYTILIPAIRYADDLLLYTGSRGYHLDWKVVGVKEDIGSNENSTIYPNPTNNSVNLLVDEKYFNGTWEIINLNGKTMLKGLILPNPNLIINVDLLSPQTYFLRLTKGNISTTYDVIKI